jgi:predicted DNA-binding transcriptional regulator YafY
MAMNSNERRLKILYMLQSGKRVTSRTLMDEFGVSKRTVFRDLRVIEKLGVPVTHYPDSGYGVMLDGLIPAIMFTFRELSVIMMGLSFVKSQVDQEMVNDAENVALKIRSAVPTALQMQMNILESKTRVSPYIMNIESRSSGGDWFVLCSAFVEKKPVSFHYHDRKGNSSRRTIDPHLLVHYTDHWNVIGFCHDRKALRNFMLSRMQDMSLRDRPFMRKQEYPDMDLLYGHSENNYTVTVSVAPDKVFSFLTELPGKIITRTIEGSWMVVSFLIDDLDFINEWLLRYGHHVVVSGPNELLEKRKHYLAMLLEKS